jgi:hypothetical protein
VGRQPSPSDSVRKQSTLVPGCSETSWLGAALEVVCVCVCAQTAYGSNAVGHVKKTAHSCVSVCASSRCGAHTHTVAGGHTLGHQHHL